MATENEPVASSPLPKDENQKEKLGIDRTRFGGKTLRNSLLLLIMIVIAIAVPLSIGIGLYQFTVQQQHDFVITVDLQYQAMLQNYLDQMSDLLLKENLRASKQGDVVRQVAEDQTLIVLQNMDPTRKGILVRFLYKSGLILYTPTSKTSPIIDLSTADLSTADLRGIGLPGADLSGAHLDGADLSGADLGGAVLSGADLGGAVLSRAFLRGADMSYVDLGDAHLDGADMSYVNLLAANVTQKQLNAAKSLQSTIMPDGIKHP
jgi:hypothetical protein